MYFLFSYYVVMLTIADRLPWLAKRELIFLLSFTCNYLVSVRRVSSSSWCLGRLR